MKDPSGLFNSSLEGNVRRAIDIHEGDKVDEAAFEGSHPRCRGAQSQDQEQAEAAVKRHLPPFKAPFDAEAPETAEKNADLRVSVPSRKREWCGSGGMAERMR